MATPEAQAAQAAAQAEHQALLEKLDMHAIHKTFRNPHWRPNQRRNKNIKTILSEAARREASAMATPRENNSGANTPVPSARASGSLLNPSNNNSNGNDDDGLSTSGTSTPMIVVGGDGSGGAATATSTASTAAAGGSMLQPNLAQANRSLSKLVLEKSLRPPTTTTTTSAGSAAASAAPGAPGAPGSAALAFGASTPTVTYTNVESAPSLAPKRRYCDITGLHGPYTDPKTRLRFHNIEVYATIRAFQQGVAEQYLELRGAHTVLK